MHVARARWPSSNGKTYESIYLRESFRQDGKVKKRDIANLTHCNPAEVAAIELALKHKGDLSALASLDGVHLQEGASIGAVWAAAEVARRLGLPQALGTDFAGQLALWQVIARLLDQGSRLSAVRLAQVHAACDVLGIRRGFDENDLYENLSWLCQHQEQIERRLFAARHAQSKPELFLYDVTSSYLEGEDNALGAYGYNRDGKKGKKQIVIGMLCDEEGTPVSTEVFRGNTQDPKTFGAQVRKASQRFGCARVTFVGDRGMIKSGQIEELSKAGFHYITAITKPQMETLLAGGVLQMALFDDSLCEVELESVRYVLRRNPVRQAELARTRQAKQQALEAEVRQANEYLAGHAKAKVKTQQTGLAARLKRLGVEGWLKLQAQGRRLELSTDQPALQACAQLDGCYVIQTDLPSAQAGAQTVHDRYKDLAQVERDFRIMKTGHLEFRPWFVCTEDNTRAHALTSMLALKVRRHLERAWEKLDLTVEEGLRQLETLCVMELVHQPSGEVVARQVPEPSAGQKQLLDALALALPAVAPEAKVVVGTRKKIQSERKALVQ